MSQQTRFDTTQSVSRLMPPGDYVRVDSRPLGEHLLLVICGEADYYTADALREDLGRALSATTCSIAIDVSQLRFCDLAGLDVLDGFCVEAEARQLPLAFHGVSPMLARLRGMFSPFCGL